MRTRKLPNLSFVKGTLPISCVMCQQGSKMVLLVTGLCNHGCWYCPLSERKLGHDVVYADELPVRSDGDVLYEARAIGARGTGITGGDPMLAVDRTAHYIELLKSEFGERHNIHLYTATPDPKKVARLADAGLDEIRFHPPPGSWGRPSPLYAESIRAALDRGMRAGVEIPAIPGLLEQMLALAAEMDGAGAQFMNLNEMEFSDTNCDALAARGFAVVDDVSSAVAGSREAAQSLARKYSGAMAIHFCSSSFKDATQLRSRLLRRARNTATGLEVITDDGLFLKGIIETPEPERLARDLRRRIGIPARLLRHDREKGRVEIAAWVLEELPGDVPGKRFLVWEYPTADRLEVERAPL